GRGSTAVEFAILAPLFIGLLISILDTGIYFFAQNVLQAAAVQSGRSFLTGQAQASNLTEAQFVSRVCPSIQALFNCGSL
ncbi:TadE/TadG family type IV pilus assembly protein, partial [Acinetobacter baumannii]